MSEMELVLRVDRVLASAATQEQRAVALRYARQALPCLRGVARDLVCALVQRDTQRELPGGAI